MLSVQLVAGLVAAASFPQVAFTPPSAPRQLVQEVCVPGWGLMFVPVFSGNMRPHPHVTYPIPAVQIQAPVIVPEPKRKPAIGVRKPAPTPTSESEPLSYSNPAGRYAKTVPSLDAEAEADLGGPIQEVIATGSAAIGEGTRQRARQAAMQQAMRNALEHVAGVYLSGATVTERFLALKDRVYTRSEGYVVPGEVLEEKLEGGAVTVRMRATVSVRPLLSQLRQLGLARNWKVAVAIREAQGNAVTGAAPVAETEIVQRLLRAGFQVVHLNAGNTNDWGEFLRGLRNTNGTPVADVLIVGTATSYLAARMPKTANGRLLAMVPVYQSRVRADAIRVETGEVVASHLADETVSNSVESVAAVTAATLAARRVATGFLDDIATLPASYTRRVQLEMHGFRDRSQAQAFEDALPLLPGVRRVQRQDYGEGCLALEVEVDSEAAERLGAEIESAKPMASFEIVVESDTKARIIARVRG